MHRQARLPPEHRGAGHRVGHLPVACGYEMCAVARATRLFTGRGYKGGTMERESDDQGMAQGAGTEHGRGEAGEEMEGSASSPAEGVLTLVCLQCGKEVFFSDDAPPEGMSCEKCGGSVFREFFTAEGDEAADDFRDVTERDLDTDDPEGDTLPGDLIDLNRGV